MPTPSVWGPVIWRFFHILIESIKEESFSAIGFQTFNMIKQICKTLPCPSCSQHATQFLSKINFKHIRIKNDFKNLIYVFHNVVNKNNSKPLFNVVDLNIYKNQNLIHAFNNFINVYHTKGNHKLIADSFARGLTIKYIKNFILQNKQYFSIFR